MDTVKGDQSTIWAPGEPTLTKTANIPPIAVQLPAKYKMDEGRAFGWILLDILGAIIDVAFGNLCFYILRQYFSREISINELSIWVFFIVGVIYLHSTMILYSIFNIYYALRKEKVILTISRGGIVDERVSSDLISWNEIDKVQAVDGPRAGYSVRLWLKPGCVVSMKGLQAIKRRTTLWSKNAGITIDIGSLATNGWVVRQLIMSMAQSAKRPSG